MLSGSLHCAARFCIHFPVELCWMQRTNLMFFICSCSSCLVDTSSLSLDGKWPQSFPAIVNKDYIQELYIICHSWFILSSHSGDLPVISAAQCNYSKLHFFFFVNSFLEVFLNFILNCDLVLSDKGFPHFTFLLPETVLCSPQVLIIFFSWDC